MLWTKLTLAEDSPHVTRLYIIIIIDNFCIALFSHVYKLTALYNTLQHFLSENKIIKGNNVHASNTYIRTNNASIYTHKYMCRMRSGSM